MIYEAARCGTSNVFQRARRSAAATYSYWSVLDGGAQHNTNGWCALPSSGRICPIGVVRSHWKAACVTRRPLRLEGGKDCKVLPLLTMSSTVVVEERYANNSGHWQNSV